MNENLRKLLLRTTVALCAAVVVVLGYSAFTLFIPADSGEHGKTEFEVKSGQGFSEVADGLYEAGLVRNRNIFVAYASLTGQDTAIKAGRYMLSPDVSPAGILRLLSQGRAESDDIVVTIPEGSNIWEVDAYLFNAGLIGKLGDFARTQFESEGYLFPDTYRFSKQLKEASGKETNSKVIADIMRANFLAKAGTVGRDIVTIASMLEEEAKRPEDMAMVSGIIANRMELGMLLQIDATVAYGWCLKALAARKYSPPCDVAMAPIALELAIDHPYNSYIRKGFPPGPISNPGLAALDAARNPQDNDYLYYLSTRDGSQLIYSKTAQEHAINRRKYLGL